MSATNYRRDADAIHDRIAARVRASGERERLDAAEQARRAASERDLARFVCWHGASGWTKWHLTRRDDATRTLCDATLPANPPALLRGAPFELAMPDLCRACLAAYALEAP